MYRVCAQLLLAWHNIIIAGMAIKVCLYDESDHIPVHTEDKIFYTEDDYRDFLARRAWTCLREFDGYRNIDNMDDLRPGAIYRGVSWGQVHGMIYLQLFVWNVLRSEGNCLDFRSLMIVYMCSTNLNLYLFSLITLLILSKRKIMLFIIRYDRRTNGPFALCKYALAVWKCYQWLFFLLWHAAPARTLWTILTVTSIEQTFCHKKLYLDKFASEGTQNMIQLLWIHLSPNSFNCYTYSIYLWYLYQKLQSTCVLGYNCTLIRWG